MSQSTQLSSRISPIGTAQLHSAIEGFKHVLNADQRQDFESSNDQPDAAAVLKFTAHLDEINSERQSRCIATRLQTVLQSVQQFSTVVETFISSNPRIAALVWGSLKFALLIASNFGSYFEKLSALFMKFGRHCPRYAEYQGLYLDSTRLQSSLCSFYATLVSCCTRAVETMKRPGWVQVTKIITLSSFESDFGPFEQELQHWSKEIKDEITAASHKADKRERLVQSEERARAEDHRIWQWRRAKEQELELEKLRSMQKRQSLLDKLSDHDFNRPWTRARRQCVVSTAQWLTHTKQFSDWVAAPDSSLLCLTGKLGSGKTILTASAIAELSRHPSSAGRIAYFFCRFDNEASLHTTTVLSSLLRQILHPESLSPDQQSSLEKMLDPGPPELADLESLIGDAISTTQFIVIDAFDECGEEERRSLLKAFQRIMNLPDRTIKLFLSSRDSDGWRTRRMFKNTLFVSTKLPESNFDLRTMVKKKLDELVEEERLVVGHQDILQEIEEHLLSKAHGMFLWVDFALQDLCSQRRDRDIKAALQRLPTGLPEMYDRLLGRIVDSGERMLVSKTFRWIACAKRPLSLEELREAIAIKPLQKSSEPDRYVNEIARIPSWSRGLVVCDEEDDVLQFAHSTIEDFLFGKSHTKANSNFHFEPNATDHELGEICVTYLNFSDFERQLVKRPKPQAPVRGQDLLEANMNVTSGQKGILRTVSKASQLAGEFLRRKTKTDVHFTLPQQESDTSTLQSIIGSHPFFQYASTYWIFHCKNFTESTWTWSLWNRLLLSESSLIKNPWSLEELSGRKECIRRFVEEQQHYGLLEWVQTSERSFGPEQLGEIFEYSITKCGPNSLAKKMFEWRETAPIVCSRVVKEIREGKIKMVLDLLDAVNPQKVDINIPAAEQDGRTALQAAVEHGYDLLAERLLSMGADVDVPAAKNGGRVALQAAAEQGHDLLVERLISMGANVNAPAAEQGGRTALQAAAEQGHILLVKKLLNMCADVNALAAEQGGRTALQAAAEQGHVQIVTKLLKLGADVNAPAAERGGRTALQAAAEEGHVQIVKKLLDAGADTNDILGVDGVPIHEQAVNQDKLLLECILFKAATGPNASEAVQNIALNIAADQGSVPMVEKLLNAGADVNAPGLFRETALHLAAKQGHLPVVEALLNAGANVDALVNPDFDVKSGTTIWPRGITALHAAVERGHASIVERLLDSGAKVNTPEVGFFEETALQTALKGNHHDIAEMLRERGAV